MQTHAQPNHSSSILQAANIKGLTNSRILIVDDDSVVRRILSNMLYDAGFNNVHSVSSGEDALRILPGRCPDLILLDLFMPGMNGLEVCSKIQELNIENPPTIIVQTGSDDEANILEAFERGAADYITKPIRAVEIASRCLVHLERRHLGIQLSNERDRMSMELNEASDLQYDLLPSEDKIQSIATPMNLDMASNVTFCSEMGGDIWGMKCISKHHLALHTVDVTGHGLKAALSTFRIHSLIQESAATRSTPSAMLSLLNNKLHGVMPTGQFATMCYMLLDTELRTLHYATAAAPLPLIIRQNGELAELQGSGLPLSCALNSQYEQHQIHIQSGDTILMHSDALFEVVPNLIEEDIVQLIHSKQNSAHDILDDLMVEVLHRLGTSTIQDDLTLVVIKIP